VNARALEETLMSLHPLEGVHSRRARVLTAALVVGIVALEFSVSWSAASVQAHCDSINGPVVSAARRALEAGDVTLILPYVRVEAEAELTAAFQQTLVVRTLGAEAQALADRYFFETVVRLHRTGEGAPYTGLREEAEESPALAAADQALVAGSLDAVYRVLGDAVQGGVGQRYQAVLAAREHALREGTVVAARHRVEAELEFEKYVYDVHQAALGLAAHTEGVPAPEHRVAIAPPSACP
jgi:hypothetical protein